LNKDFNNITVSEKLKESTLKKAKKRGFVQIKAVAAILVCVLALSVAAIPVINSFNASQHGDGNIQASLRENNASDSSGYLTNESIDVSKPDRNDSMEKPDGSVTTTPASDSMTAPGDSFEDSGIWEDSSASATSKPDASPLPTQYTGLTASYLDDNLNVDVQGNWLNPLKNMVNDYDVYGITATKRIKIRVFTQDKKRASDVKVTLYSGQRKILSAITNVEGDAFLFYGWHKGISVFKPDRITLEKNGAFLSVQVDESTENLELTLNTQNTAPTNLDVMFVIDATGSMGDELSYLKKEVQSMLTGFTTNLNVLTSINFYRDKGDDFVVKSNPFKPVAEAVGTQFADITASGGGDMPEAVHTALDDGIFNHEWREDSVKILFLVLDAHAHENDTVSASLIKSIEAASKMGIRIVPVLSSGANTTCEIMCRELGLLTGGKFVFLTDHSGIGSTHHKPATTIDYIVKPLITILKQTIAAYTGTPYIS
jgi:hypothetical protein